MVHPSDHTDSEYQSKELINSLQREIKELKLIIAGLLALQERSSPVQATVKLDRTQLVFTGLPNEIILQIFKETAPSWHEYDPSTRQGARNPWLEALRTKKALTLVSKSTLGLARMVLYEDIVLRRMGQIPALARTLWVADNSAFHNAIAHLVRSIRIDQCPIHAKYNQTIHESLSVILERCTRLRSFSYHPHCNFAFKMDHDINRDPEYSDRYYFNPMWLVTPDGPLFHPLLLTLQTLVLTIPLSHATITAVHHLLRSARALTSLVLAATEIERHIDLQELMRLPVIRMDSLLSLEIEGGHPDLPRYVASRWEMPRLTQLTLLRCTEYPASLLNTSGVHLTFLHLYVCNLSAIASFSQDQIENIPRICPALVHLVIPELQCGPLTLRSSSLQFLDVWAESVDTLTLAIPEGVCAAVRARLLSSASDVPSLRYARLLLTLFDDSEIINPPTLRTAYRRPEWPRLCHPTLIESNSRAALFTRVPGAWVAQFPWGLGSVEHPEVERCNIGSELEDDWLIGPALRVDEWFNLVSRESAGILDTGHDSADPDEDAKDQVDGEALWRSRRLGDENAVAGALEDDSAIILDRFARSQETKYHMHMIWDADQ